MRLDNMTELLMQQFPGVPRVQIIFDLNAELVQFCRKTKVLYTRARLTLANDQIAEDDTLCETTWSLPANMYELDRVEQIVKEDWYVSGSTLYVRWVDSSVDTLDIEYSRYPLAIALDSDEPEVPEEFHYAIVYALMYKYTARYKADLASAGFYKSQYKEMEREAKKYALTRNTRNQDPSIGGILKKTFYRTGVTVPEGQSTVDMDVTFSTVDSYSVILNGNGIQIEEYDPNLNHDERTTTSFEVMSAAANTRLDIIVVGV